MMLTLFVGSLSDGDDDYDNDYVNVRCLLQGFRCGHVNLF